MPVSKQCRWPTNEREKMKLTIDMTMKEGEENLPFTSDRKRLSFLGENKVNHLHNVADLIECYTRLKEVNDRSKELAYENSSKPYGGRAEQQFAHMFREIQPEFSKMVKALERIMNRIE